MSIDAPKESFWEKIKEYFAGSYHIRIILGSLFAVVVADGIITKFLVSKEFAVEGNPFLGDWVNNGAFYTLKICGALIAVLYLWSIHKHHPNLSVGFSCVLLAAYTYIIVWNLSIIW